MSGPVFAARLDNATVAQSCTLLYRRFSICQAWQVRTASPVATRCRMQFGDTADYKSALQRYASPVGLEAVPKCVAVRGLYRFNS